MFLLMHMIVSNQTYNKNSCIVNFSSNNREIYNIVNGSKILRYRNNSCFFRDDLDWNKLADTLTEKYKNVDKVNVYCFGCSEGAEPFSLAMILMQKLGIKSKKFFPIMASDIDGEILKNPKKGIITPSESDFFDIRNSLGEDYTKYLQVNKLFEPNSFLADKVSLGKIKPPLENKIIFKQAEIRSSIPKIKKDNSVILCRNFWNYMKYGDVKATVQELYNHLGQNCICIIGDFDGLDIERCFKDAGFKSNGNRYWLTKEKPKEKHFLNPQLLMNIFGNKI